MSEPARNRIVWRSTVSLLGVAAFVGFILFAPFKLSGQWRGGWYAICRAIGIELTSDAALAVQPTPHTSSRIGWTRATLHHIATGNTQRGAAVALSCGACHGDRGVSPNTQVPTLAGLDAAVIYKQLDDYRTGKRPRGVMGAIASALGDADRVDVAVYFASLPGGIRGFNGAMWPAPGHDLRQDDPALRLIFAGDPWRGIAPCAACHGPDGAKLGAPALLGQHTAYIERQLASFAQGARTNDINEQMRAVAAQLTPAEIHAVALYYGAPAEKL